MTIHLLYPQEAPQPQQAQDNTGTAYDSVWANQAVPGSTTGLEGVMLAQDKLFVVLTVVLIIWSGIVFMLYRTDRKLLALERTVSENIPEEEVF